MALRVPNLGLGDAKTGDTELKIRQDYNHNFSDQSNAASRLVGVALGNVVEVCTSGIAGTTTLSKPNRVSLTQADIPNATMAMWRFPADYATAVSNGLVVSTTENSAFILTGYGAASALTYMNISNLNGATQTEKGIVAANVLLRGLNANPDSNGFYKEASPVVDLYDDKIESNHDAQKQAVTFEKVSTGDYLLKGSLGFAQEGWYIETPKDANGNVLVAVVYGQLANNDLSIKTYAKRFDDETGDIVANLLKPRDIPIGRFISLRLHELPIEPPALPTETQPEV